MLIEAGAFYTMDGSAAAYPDTLRRVVYFDAVTGKRLNVAQAVDAL
jgi:hypothetical protein